MAVEQVMADEHAVAPSVEPRKFDFAKLKGAANGVPSQAVIDRQAAKTFWKIGGKGYTIIPLHVREFIVETGAEIVIQALRDGVSKFGPTWFATVEYEGQLWTLPQSHNDVRDQLMVNIQQYLAEVGPLPATLAAFDTALGQGWDFAPVPEDDDQYSLDVSTLSDGDVVPF